MKPVFCIIAFLCPYFMIAQQPLIVGKAMPSARLYKIDQPPGSASVKIPAAPLTVLNFMGTHCSGCIAALPLMDSLQKKYNGQFNLYLLSEESPATIKKWILKKNYKGPPFMTGAKNLRRFFPYEYISHLVWLNQQGKVIAITGKEYFTGPNIEKALAGNVMHWPVKQDDRTNDDSSSLFSRNIQTDWLTENSRDFRYTAIFPFQQQLSTATKWLPDTAYNTSRLTLINKPLLFWYLRGLNIPQWPLSNVIVNDSNRAMYHYNSSLHYKAAWNRVFTWSYESLANPALPKAAHWQQLLSDADKFFGIEHTFKDTLVPALFLTEIDSTVVNQYTPQPAAAKLELSSLLYHLNNEFTGVPAFDGRLHRQACCIPFSGKLPLQTAAVNKLLQPHNLQLVKKDSMVRMLIFTRIASRDFLSPAKTYIK